MTDDSVRTGHDSGWDLDFDEPCREGEHCMCIVTGDVEYVGEPFYAMGFVVECCKCDATEVVPDKALTDEMYAELAKECEKDKEKETRT